MSSAFSRKMAGVSTRLLTKYGSTVSLIRVGAKVWDSDLGEYVFGPDTTLSLAAVPVPVETGLINGTTIQAGDMIVKADGAVEPKMEDKVAFASAQWSIVNIERKLVNDQTVAWFIQVRK
jgi:hypothetical protein